MPLPTNNSRPSLPYTPAQSLPNNQRFSLLGRRPPTAEMLDAEFNALQDDINTLAQSINEVQAGNIPGSDDPNNANKVVKTDGEGNLSFTSVTSALLEANAVVEQKLAPQSVTTAKLGNAAVIGAKIAEETIESRHLAGSAVGTEELANHAVTTAKMAGLAVTASQIAAGAVITDKLAPNAVTTEKVAATAITAEKLANNAVTTDKLAANAVTGGKVADQSLPPSKIQSGAAPVQSVLTVTSLGNSAFAALPVTGKILQIQSTVLRTQSSVNGATSFTEFSTPLSVTLTTRAANSTILVFVAANLVGGYRANSHLNYPQTVYYALYKNGALWPTASGTRGTNQISGLGQVRSEAYTDVVTISALASETIPTSNTRVIYSLRAYHASGAEYYVMLNSQLPDDGSGTYSGIASISSLYAIEIGG